MSDSPTSPPELPSENADTRLVSFVIRFVYHPLSPAAGAASEAALTAAPAEVPAPGWHGVIRHVQSDAERYFTHWSDAVAFIGQYVSV